MKKIIKDALILFAITLVSGLLLGFVYELTEEPRANQAEIKKNNAYKTVFTDYYKDLNIDDAQFNSYDISSFDILRQALDKVGYTSNVVTVDEVVSAELNGEMLGYVVTVTSKEGYGGDIQFTVGVTPDGTITGLSYLSISETAGLGMKAKEKAFIRQYVGKNGGSFIVNKDNTSGLANEIDAISGATVTSRAVTKGVNVAYITVLAIVSGGDINE